MSKVYKRILFTVFSVLIGFNLGAQESAENIYSPYSIFGFGDMFTQGSALSRSMGGTGIAMRNNRYINYLNPAAVTARDSLSFMADFNLSSINTVFSQGGSRSVHNSFNISGLAITTPIYGKSALIAGITPFSNVAFDFKSTSSELLAHAGYITRNAEGSGGIYQLFLGAGIPVGNHFNVGVQGIYYFGKLNKKYSYTFSSSSINSLYSGYSLELNTLSGKVGVQYETRVLDGLTLTAGVTHRLKTKMKGVVTDYKYASLSSVTDTLRHKMDTLGKGRGVYMSGETGIGIALRKGDKWLVEVDYTFSDWKNSGLDLTGGFASGNSAAKFSTTMSQSLRAGVEFTPNRNDIRYYFRRCSYRAGVYFDQSYYKLNGNNVNSFGLTFGMTLPIFRWYNGLTLGVDMGQRGATRDNMIRERYVRFSIGFNIHDIWFQKPRYD